MTVLLLLASNNKALAKILNDTRRKLKDYNTNLVTSITQKSMAFFSYLEDLLEDKDFKAALGIDENIDKAQCLAIFTQKMGVNTGMSTDKYDALLELADKMSILLQEIADHEWTERNAAGFYAEYKRFRDISDAWTQINGVNYYLKAKVPSQ